MYFLEQKTFLIFLKFFGTLPNYIQIVTAILCNTVAVSGQEMRRKNTQRGSIKSMIWTHVVCTVNPEGVNRLRAKSPHLIPREISRLFPQ